MNFAVQADDGAEETGHGDASGHDPVTQERGRGDGFKIEHQTGSPEKRDRKRPAHLAWAGRPSSNVQPGQSFRPGTGKADARRSTDLNLVVDLAHAVDGARLLGRALTLLRGRHEPFQHHAIP